MNKCLNCGSETDNKYCNAICMRQHISEVGIPKDSVKKRCETNKAKWKQFTVRCHKCNDHFDISEYNVTEPKKEKYFCSRSCANSRTWSDTDKLKMSLSAKSSETIKIANKKNGEVRSKPSIEKTCKHCELKFSVRAFKSNQQFCSKACYRQSDKQKSCGGYRKGSGSGKAGWYKGYWCDSSWELAWVMYNIDYGNNFKRNSLSFNYFYNGKISKYLPDFIMDGVYYEIKGYVTERSKAKTEQFKDNLIIVDKEKIKPYLEYAVKIYGKDFIKHYENNPHNELTKTCLICGKPCKEKNVVCSRRCSGLLVSQLADKK